MISVIWIIFILLLLICAWTANIERAMLISSPLVLRHELEIRGAPSRGLWIEDQYESSLQSLALVKVIAFTGMIFCFALLPNAETVTLGNFVSGAACAAVLYWFFACLIASAIAKTVPIGSVLRSWYILRLISLLNPIIHWFVDSVWEVTRRLTGANLPKSESSTIVEEQLLRSIEHSQREGSIPAEAAEMMENVVDLGDTDVGEIMTPRTDVKGIELTNNIGAIRTFVLESGHSRIPVYEENLDQILGILYVKDMIGFLGSDTNGFELKNILRKPIVVPDTKPVQELLADFQTSEVHMAVVIDEYGGTAGLVTIEDILEEIVGEIRDEHDDSEADEPEFQRVSETIIEVDGRFNLDDFNDELGLELPEDEEYDTIAGFILATIGHVPLQGESVETAGMKITAIEVSETQIIRLSVVILPSEE